MVSNVADTSMAKIKRRKIKEKKKKNGYRCMWTMKSHFQAEWLGNSGDHDFELFSLWKRYKYINAKSLYFLSHYSFTCT